MVGVLHTWTRDLRYHPHVHYLVPAGGLAADGQTWRAARKNFLLPVKALSRLFRGHFRQALQKTAAYGDVPARVWTHEWVVHCKPVGTGRTALKYLAPYIFRVALSNRRLVKLEHDRLTFRYQDSQTRQTKLCTLPVEAFLHRFLQHVLPKGFVKVRYYGFFAPGRRRPLAALQQHLGHRPSEPPDTHPTAPVAPPATRLTTIRFCVPAAVALCWSGRSRRSAPVHLPNRLQLSVFVAPHRGSAIALVPDRFVYPCARKAPRCWPASPSQVAPRLFKMPVSAYNQRQWLTERAGFGATPSS